VCQHHSTALRHAAIALTDGLIKEEILIMYQTITMYDCTFVQWHTLASSYTPLAALLATRAGIQPATRCVIFLYFYIFL
jgi:hypothetical protein